jgi:hypothetical protein
MNNALSRLAEGQKGAASLLSSEERTPQLVELARHTVDELKGCGARRQASSSMDTVRLEYLLPPSK